MKALTCGQFYIFQSRTDGQIGLTDWGEEKKIQEEDETSKLIGIL